jgi:hypothetical protein
VHRFNALLNHNHQDKAEAKKNEGMVVRIIGRDHLLDGIVLDGRWDIFWRSVDR